MEALPLRAGGEIDRIIDRCQNAVYGLALARTGSRAAVDIGVEDSALITPGAATAPYNPNA